MCLAPQTGQLAEHGHAGHWIRTARSECLDHIIIPNEARLRWALGEFVGYYSARRPHRSLGLRPPGGPADGDTAGEVCRRRPLGGLIDDYYRRAA